jgi:hypothetical protein
LDVIETYRRGSKRRVGVDRREREKSVVSLRVSAASLARAPVDGVRLTVRSTQVSTRPPCVWGLTATAAEGAASDHSHDDAGIAARDQPVTNREKSSPDAGLLGQV